jgi:hypothetical protein
MRTLALALVAASLAVPAAAQVTPLDLDNLRAQQEAAQRREIDLSNQLMAAEARQRADQAVTALQLQQRLPPQVPAVAPRSGAVPAATPSYPQIPDSLLADSNAKVQTAASRR